MVIEPDINVGNILTIVAFCVGGLVFIYTLRARVDVMNSGVENLAKRVLGMEQQLVRLVDVLVEQGRQAERIAATDQRLLAQGGRIDELERRVNRTGERFAEH